MHIDIHEALGVYSALVTDFDPESQDDLDALESFMQDGPSLYQVELTSTAVTFQDDRHTVHPARKITIQPRLSRGEEFGRADIVKILARSPGFGIPMDVAWIESKLQSAAIKLDAGAVFSQEDDSVGYQGTTFSAIANGERLSSDEIRRRLSGN